MISIAASIRTLGFFLIFDRSFSSVFSVSPCLLWKEIGLDSGDMGKDRIQGEHRDVGCSMASDWSDAHHPSLSLVRRGQSLLRREGDNSQHKQQPGWQHWWQHEHNQKLVTNLEVWISLFYLEICCVNFVVIYCTLIFSTTIHCHRLLEVGSQSCRVQLLE